MAENVEVLLKLRGSRQFVAQATAAAMGVDKIGDAAEHTAAKTQLATKRQSKFAGVMAKMRGVAVTGAAALGVAGGAAAAMGIKYNASMEQTQVAFKQFLGSTEAATAMIKRLQELNLQTPFEFPELAGTTKRLMAMGFSAEDAFQQTKNLSDAVAGMGGGGAELDRASLAIGQIMAKGRLQGDEMLQLTELGIVGAQDMAKQLGYTGKEFFKAMEAGKVSSGDALTAINAITNTKFGGAAAAQSKTFAGQLSNLKDAAGRLLGEAFMPLFLFLRDVGLPALSDAMPAISNVANAFGVVLVGSINGVITAMGFLIEHWNTIKTIFMVIAPVLAYLVTYFVILKTVVGLLGIASKILGGVIWVLNAAMAANPVILIIAGIILLVAAFVLAYKKVGWFRKAVQATWQWIKDHWRLLVVLLAGPMGLAIVLIINNWKKIKKVAKPILDWLAGAIRTVVEAIKDVAEWIGKLPWDKVGKVLGMAAKGAGKVANFGNKILGGKAAGGPVTRSGAYLVGERGPEVVGLRAGSHVFPTPNVAPVGPSLEPRTAQPMVTKVYIGKRQVAEAVGEYLAEQKARR